MFDSDASTVPPDSEDRRDALDIRMSSTDRRNCEGSPQSTEETLTKRTGDLPNTVSTLGGAQTDSKKYRSHSSPKSGRNMATSIEHDALLAVTSQANVPGTDRNIKTCFKIGAQNAELLSTDPNLANPSSSDHKKHVVEVVHCSQRTPLKRSPDILPDLLSGMHRRIRERARKVIPSQVNDKSEHRRASRKRTGKPMNSKGSSKLRISRSSVSRRQKELDAKRTSPAKVHSLPGLSAITNHVITPNVYLCDSSRAYKMEDTFSFPHLAHNIPCLRELMGVSPGIGSIQCLKAVAKGARCSPRVAFEGYFGAAKSAECAMMPLRKASSHKQSKMFTCLCCRVLVTKNTKFETELRRARAKLAQPVESSNHHASDGNVSQEGQLHGMFLRSPTCDDDVAVSHHAAFLCSTLRTHPLRVTRPTSLTLEDPQPFLNCLKRGFVLIKRFLLSKNVPVKNELKEVLRVFRDVILRVLEGVLNNQHKKESFDKTFKSLFAYVLSEINAVYKKMLPVNGEVYLCWSWTVSSEMVGSLRKALCTESPGSCYMLDQLVESVMHMIASQIRRGEEDQSKLSIEALSNSMEIAMGVVMSSQESISLASSDLVTICRHNFLVSEQLLSSSGPNVVSKSNYSYDYA